MSPRPLRRARAGDAAGERGFALIEAVVALAIAALGLGIVLANASFGLGNAGLAQQYIEATQRAQSRLAAVAAAPVTPSIGHGDDGDGYSWQVVISPPLADASADATLLAYPVAVTVSWRSGFASKSVTLRTMRVGARPQAHE